MQRVDFLVLDIDSPEAAAEAAAEHGWIARPPPARVLRSIGAGDSALTLRNPDAPMDLILVASEVRLRLIGRHSRGRRDDGAPELRVDDEEFDALVEDAPVVEHLVELLDHAFHPAGRSG